MRTVHKFQLDQLGPNQIEMAQGRPLVIGFQSIGLRTVLVMWVDIVIDEPHAVVETRHFQDIPTGREVPPLATWVGTATHPHTGEVHHVFEVY